MSECCDGGPAFEGGNNTIFSETAVHLRDCFRLLWQQHVYWTRMVILGIAFTLPDLEPAIQRLLRNPNDFVRLFSPLYGTETADEFGRLLKGHLLIAAELVRAVKAGDSESAAFQEKMWYKNADDIVHFLNQTNPCWSVDFMRSIWYRHLALTKQEAVATVNKNSTKSIKKFNQIEQTALMLADDFSSGVICQFCL